MLGSVDACVTQRYLSGAQALAQAVFINSAFESEFAHLLYDVGRSVTARDGYGDVTPLDAAKMQNAVSAHIARVGDALSWHLAHGGKQRRADARGFSRRVCASPAVASRLCQSRWSSTRRGHGARRRAGAAVRSVAEATRRSRPVRCASARDIAGLYTYGARMQLRFRD
jgi:hypothetical protein